MEAHIPKPDVDILLKEARKICLIDSERRIVESNGKPHSVYVTTADRYFFACARLSKLVQPAIQLLGSDVYVHQYKLNPKVARFGSAVPWHRDFPYWHQLDGMPTDRVLTVGILLEDVTTLNGPLLVSPGTHAKNSDTQAQDMTLHVGASESRAGLGWRNTFISGASTVVGELKLTTSPPSIGEAIQVVGPAGSIVIIHGSLVHGSEKNISDHDRFMAFLTYNSTENTLRDIPSPRPEYVANRIFDPLHSIEANSLIEIHQNISTTKTCRAKKWATKI